MNRHGHSLIPRPSQLFQHCMRNAGGPGIRSHVTDFIRVKGGRRVKMNVGDPKISEVQGAAIHDLLEVRFRNCQAIVVQLY